ncbi:hypothetical protein PENTCL1PPCAC_18406 [Pristionchus entomophagus]|uniref:UPAR/Ly6 domain-containing protein n=1 Tax=Pristionchus entomophagus TaxID=358040 RepID=A0AAV5TPI3_9BILA|nr:hypothetical protein PENTCL1PPCAC_18406 [Pristionchus entomophagus]
MMHRSLILILCALISISLAIRCYSSQNTVPGPSSQMVIVNCPSAQFCFKSYIERNVRGDNSYTETRTCGNVGTCFQTGCTGSGDNRKCCCAGDLCNSAEGGMGKALFISFLLPVVLQFF